MLSMEKRSLWHLAEGTKEQRKMVQDALNYWWESLLLFFGPPSKQVLGLRNKILPLNIELEQVRMKNCVKHF